MKRFRYTNLDFKSWQFAIVYRNPFAIIKARMIWLCTKVDIRIVGRRCRADLD